MGGMCAYGSGRDVTVRQAEQTGLLRIVAPVSMLGERGTQKAVVMVSVTRND